MLNDLTWPDGTRKSQNNAFDWRGTSEFMRKFAAEAHRSDQNGSAGRSAAKINPQVLTYSPARVAADLIASAKATGSAA